jgi:hypothetical protein
MMLASLFYSNLIQSGWERHLAAIFKHFGSDRNAAVGQNLKFSSTCEVEGSGHIFTLGGQPIECCGGIGSCLGDDFDLKLLQGLPDGLGYPHVSGISGADNQNLRSGGQNIINITNGQMVSLLAPPVSDNFAANDF